MTKNNYKYILSEDKKIYKLEADLENGEKFILTNSFNYEDNLKNVDNKDELEKLPNEDWTCSDWYLKFEWKCKLPWKMVLSYKWIKAGDIIELWFKWETNIVKIDWWDDWVNNCINNFEWFINSENIKSYDLPIRCIYNNVSKSDYIITVNWLSSGYWTVHSWNQNFRSAKWIEKLERVIEWTDMWIKTFQGWFMWASSLISLPENLDVSKIENFWVMFLGASLFNQNISNWDMSSAKDLTAMFYEASSFNQPLNSWNVSKVKNMDYMFFMAVDFYQDISSWDVRWVPTMPSTFQHWWTRFREHHRKETNWYNNDYLPELWKIKN